jgi:hypothetical protein
MLVPKPKKAFQSQGTHSAGFEAFMSLTPGKRSHQIEVRRQRRRIRA